MKTITICLDTRDTDYAKALSNSLQHHSSYFSIQLNLPLHDSHGLDLILTDDMSVSAERVVYLTEDPTSESVNIDEGSYILYKYQHVGHISNMLRLAHSKYSTSEMVTYETENTNIISVCSASGGTGCTSVALGICQELKRFHGKEVLYICLEEFESTKAYFPEYNVEPNNITKYVYAVINKDVCCNITPEGYMNKDDYGVYTFHPSRGRNPLRELSGNEFVQFINKITNEKLFTDLILDCGNGLDDSVVSAFQLSSVICHVMGMRTDISRRTNYLMAVKNKMGSNDSIGLLNVLNMYVKPNEGAPENMKGTEQMMIPIEEDCRSFQDVNGHTSISLDKMFGQGIRDIVQHMVRTNK